MIQYAYFLERSKTLNKKHLKNYRFKELRKFKTWNRDLLLEELKFFSSLKSFNVIFVPPRPDSCWFLSLLLCQGTFLKCYIGLERTKPSNLFGTSIFFKHPTPLKTNIDNQTDDLEEVSHFSNMAIWGIHVSFRGCITCVHCCACVTLRCEVKGTELQCRSTCSIDPFGTLKVNTRKK